MTLRCRDAAVALGLVSVFQGALAQTGDGPIEKVSVRAVAHFGFDGAALAERDRARLLAEVGQMQGVTWQSVQAVGHADSVGPDAYNRALSERRAQAVKTYLVNKGLAPDMIRTEGKSSSAPRASNETPRGRAANRRTEVEFTGVRTRSP